MFRFTNPLHRLASVDAVVVGGGPSGIAVVGNLLKHLPKDHRQLWIDPAFGAGRVNERYREVPSNTKVDLFLKFATAIEPFQHIVDQSRAPNAFTALRDLPQDQGCELGYAADLCMMLTNGLARHFDHVQQHHGEVIAANFDMTTQLWTVEMDNAVPVTTPRLVMCTGSNPITEPPPSFHVASRSSKTNIASVPLDTALKPSLLAQTFERDGDATVAVVGASHSAILVLMNLFNLASTTHPQLRIKWFSRHKSLRYAKFMDGWILYDNTGLKGQAAQWARDNLEDETFAASPACKIITKIWTPPNEEKHIYQAELPACTHIIQAIGYQKNPLPQLTFRERPRTLPKLFELEHDGLTGRFLSSTHSLSALAERLYVPGLFGAGIAFPERVTDPMGNVEYAVGFWKFMNFCKRVVPRWAQLQKS